MSDHVSQNVADALWYGLVIYRHEVFGVRVDLESFVKAEGGLNLFGTYEVISMGSKCVEQCFEYRPGTEPLPVPPHS